MNAIETRGLTKDFDGLVAVNNVDLSVKQGELFGLLGPNGAGKTTTIKVLATLLKATSGKASVWGTDVEESQDDVRRAIGIVFQDPAVDDQLTGEENLDFHARMYGMSAKDRKSRISEVLKLVDLTDKAGVLVKNYSGGMRRRLEIARGLMHFPKVLFLDEPTLGLDPQTRRKIWDYIKKLNREEKVTVILTTHYMEEADYLCDKVGIIDLGKVLVVDKPSNLKNAMGNDIISLSSDKCDSLKSILSKQKWAERVKKHNGCVSVGVRRGEEKIPRILEIARKHSIRITSVSLRKPTLEDVFIHYTGKAIRDSESSAKDRLRNRIRMGGHG